MHLWVRLFTRVCHCWSAYPRLLVLSCLERALESLHFAYVPSDVAWFLLTKLHVKYSGFALYVFAMFPRCTLRGVILTSGMIKGSGGPRPIAPLRWRAIRFRPCTRRGSASLGKRNTPSRFLRRFAQFYAVLCRFALLYTFALLTWLLTLHRNVWQGEATSSRYLHSSKVNSCATGRRKNTNDRKTKKTKQSDK